METARQVLSIAAISLDCADHNRLADFYSQLLNGTVGWRTDTAAGVRAGLLHLIAQRVDDYQPPQWPGISIVHLDLSSPGFDLAEQQSLPSPVEPRLRRASLITDGPSCSTPPGIRSA